jgi:NAD(P)H-hydrate epimerase
MRYIPRSYIRKSYPKREAWSHKGDSGRLLVVGGSRTYSGAPGLAALASLRTGCDLATVAAPDRAANIIATFSPDLITEPMAGNFLNNWHTHTILDLSKSADAVVLGSGLGRRRETMTFVQNLLSRIDKPCVIDADAIHAVALNKKIIKPCFLLTPHSREFQSLSGIEASTTLKERALQTRDLSRSLGCTILLKGHIDVISDGTSTALNKTGCSFMTKGGTGDTLSGICGALLAMGLEPFKAACSSAYLNGLAGEIASKNLGPGMLATDILQSIPLALNKTIG